MNYTPPYTITNEMIELVSSISEKIGKITALQNLEAKPHLRKNNRIKSIYSSLKIEANSLTLGQVRDVIDGQLVLGEQKEIQEVKNAYEAYGHMNEINPYSLKELKQMHGIMTRYLVTESGSFRQGEEGVFNGEKCIFMAPPARFVPKLMEELFEWMHCAKDKVHPLILSSIFHYEFVFIHPFSDGNGRMARLWHTCLLANWKSIFQYIPIESQIEKFQDEYYDVIAQCHMNGNSNVFIEFMLMQIDQILEKIMPETEAYGENVSEYIKRLLDVMEYGIPYTANAIMEKLQIKSKETFRKNYLNPAMQLQFVQMTIPEKPRSRNQRYIRK